MKDWHHQNILKTSMNVCVLKKLMGGIFWAGRDEETNMNINSTFGLCLEAIGIN